MTIFQADDATLGYLNQLRFALVNSLQRWRRGESFETFVERADDVEFQVESGPVLYQLKHKLKAAGDLSDKSADWWKTLRIWCEGTQAGTIPVDATFFLITSAAAPVRSAAASLTPSGPSRNPTVAVALLTVAANSTKNKKNADGVHAFNALNASDRMSLVSRIFVLDNSKNVEQLREDTKAEVRPAVQHEFIDDFADRLEGWWVRRVVSQLVGGGTQGITSGELDVFLDDLREQFSRQSLPIDPDILKLAADITSHRDRNLVRQLELVQAGDVRVFQAVRDFLRASTQRSRWVSGQLLGVSELDYYEDKLRDEWKLAHAQRCDELGPSASDDEMRNTGRRVLLWAESETAHLRIRPKVEEPFVVRGSLQKLADELEIGWHPQFLDRLAAVISEESP